MRPLTLFVVVSLLCLPLVAITGGAVADTRAQYQELVSLRSALAQRLQQRQDQSQARVLSLRAESAADLDDLELVLKHFDGKWVAQAWVPGWDQLEMTQYRRYFYSSKNMGAWVPRHRFAADPSALSLKDNLLSGKLAVAFKLDQTQQEKLPPGQRVNWWDRFEGRAYTKERPQTYQIEASVDPGAAVVEFFLESAIEWPPAAPQKHNPNAPSILVRCQVPATRFTPVEVRTLGWNVGRHEGLGEGLKYENGRLFGDLVVILHSDSWFPNTTKIRPASSADKFPKLAPLTGKLLGRMPPIVATFSIEAKLEGGVVRGTYKASGDMGQYEGTLFGRGGAAVIGRFNGRGALPECAGMLRGMLLSDPAKIEAALANLPALPADDAATLKTIADSVDDVLLDIRALHMALQFHPLPLEEARRQMDVVRAQWPADGPKAELLGQYLSAALTSCKSALDPQSTPTEFVAEKGGLSPVAGSKAMEQRDGQSVLAADARGWQHVGQWMVAGPYQQRDGFEQVEAFMPEIVAVPTVPLQQPLDRARNRITRKAGKGGSPPPSEWVATPGDLRLMPANLKSWEAGSHGDRYYAVASIVSDKKQTVWFNVGTYDYGKLWLNGKLLWTEAQMKSVRHRPLGRWLVKAELQQGPHQVLLRLDQDRRSAWMTLALTTQDPQAAQDLPAPKASRLTTSAAPVNPPMACDITKGTNIAWQDQKLAGHTVPVVVDDRIYLSHGSGSLTCLELASGKMLWTQTVAAAAVPADPQGRPAGWASAPVADGKQVAFATFDGQLAAYDRDGKQLWSKPTGLKGSQVRQFEGVLVVQGTADASWGPLMDRSELPTNLKRAPTGVVMFKATDGSEIGRYSSNRKNEEGQFIQPRGSDKVYYVMNAFVLLDLADAKPALAIDTFCPLEQAVSVSTDTIYLSSLGWRTAILVYVQPDGRLAWRHTWESSTDHKGYTDAPALVHKGMLWSWSHVVDHGPHCPDRRSALYVDDAGTGYPIVRVKPVLQHTVGSYQTPVVAGDYVCFLAGGGHPYGASDFSRMSMVSADGQFFVAQPGMELDIRSVKPVFAGDRLLVRSATSLTCVRVNGDEGRKFQAQQLATAVLRYIGPEPMGGKVLSIEPAQDLKPSPDVPVGLVQSYPTQYWLGAGPFPPGDEPSPQLAQLRGRIGTEVTLNGKTLKLAPLSTQHAANAPPLYLRQAELQGTGDTMPVFDAFLDPRVYSGKEASGVFYTVLDNTIERVVKPAWYEERMRGISVWVNGQMIPKDQAMHLRPGLYPVVIRIDPAFYDREVRLDEMPIDVAKALEAKAADAINWPTTWHVVGPLPGDVKSLPAEQLASMPGATMKIEDDEFEVHQIPTRDSLLLLTGLLTHTKGTKSDWSKAPVEIEIAAPFLALCYAQIDVPEDGSLYVNASADWYMRWYVDGNMVCDTMATGNKGPARLVTAQAFEVPLKKGKHVVCVQVKPGSKGWLVTSQAAFSSKPKADLKAFELVRGPKEGFDFRFRPCFSEVPSPAAIQQRYQQRLSYCEPRLAAIVRDLPDSVEARGAQALLEKLRQSKASQP